MSKKGLLGPLRSPQVIAIALGFILAGVIQTIAGQLVSGTVDSLLNKLNMRNGDGSFSLNLGTIISNVLIAVLSLVGVLLFARWAGGDDKSEA